MFFSFTMHPPSHQCHRYGREALDSGRDEEAPTSAACTGPAPRAPCLFGTGEGDPRREGAPRGGSLCRTAEGWAPWWGRPSYTVASPWGCRCCTTWRSSCSCRRDSAGTRHRKPRMRTSRPRLCTRFPRGSCRTEAAPSRSSPNLTERGLVQRKKSRMKRKGEIWQ